MHPLFEPNGFLLRSPDKALDEYEGEPADRFDGSAALRAGTPLGRGRVGNHAIDWRTRTSRPGYVDRWLRDACRRPNPSFAEPASVRAVAGKRNTQGATQ
jgi:hypothetical protein